MKDKRIPFDFLICDYEPRDLETNSVLQVAYVPLNAWTTLEWSQSMSVDIVHLLCTP